MSLQPEPLERAKIIIQAKINASRSKPNKILMQEILDDLNGIYEESHEELPKLADVAKSNYKNKFVSWISTGGGCKRVSRIIGSSYDSLHRMFEGEQDVTPPYMALIIEGEKMVYWRHKYKTLIKELKKRKIDID